MVGPSKIVSPGPIHMPNEIPIGRTAETRRQWVLQALEQFEPLLIRYAQRLTDGDWDRTCEAVQHTFLKLCQQDPDGIVENLGGWLCAVCRNKVFDDLRSAGRRPQLSDSAMTAQPASGDGPARRAERAELSRLLDERIERLPPAQRTAIELWRCGASYPEIAALLDKDQSTIRVAVHRAITSLRADPAIANWLFDEPTRPDPANRPTPGSRSGLRAVI
jgi:RNA polymerase sigma factor (sigma-70 family)